MTKITKNVEGMYVIEQGNCEGQVLYSTQYSYYRIEYYGSDEQQETGRKIYTNHYLFGDSKQDYMFTSCLQFTEEDMKHISHNAIDLINILSQSSDLNPLGLVTSFGVGGCVRDTILNNPAKDMKYYFRNFLFIYE